jgi:uncharacterized protein (TIGR03067 family)
MQHLWRGCTLVALTLICSALGAQERGADAELSRLQGNWRIIELVDDGTAIPATRIKDWVPSGGRIEIADNGIIFADRLNGQKHIKTFSIDPTTYPKKIVVVAHDEVESQGIYRFDNERLLLCLGNPALTAAPTDFSARKDSRRMMMVLVRDADTTIEAKLVINPPRKPVLTPVPKPIPVAVPILPPPPATTVALPPLAAPTVPHGLSDAAVVNLLVGTWRLNDGAGLLDITLNRDGTFRSYREALDLSTFHTVFVQSPVSSGTWNVQRGTLVAHVVASTRLDRVNQTIPLVVRTISVKDLVYVDYLGRVGQATKIR